MYILNDVIKTLEEIAPPYLAESWDNVGLMIGTRKQKIDRILCALDLNEQVLDEAIEKEAQCIVTHHPFIFKPLYCIDFDTPKGSIIQKAICHDIAVYAMHTNYDIAEGGINDILCQKLAIGHTQVLHISHSEKLYKVAVYVPEESYEQIRDIIIEKDMCNIGQYKGCTFTLEGEGTFVPLQGSIPYLGTVNCLQKVNERKIEFMIHPKDMKKMLQAIKEVHPYEEMAYDVYTLNNMNKTSGIGRYGELEQETTLDDLIMKLKQMLNISHVRVTNTENKRIKRVAVCSGSGSSFIKRASEVADVYITSDIKFHEAQEASALGLTVIDIGHYVSENIAMAYITSELNSRLKGMHAMSSAVNCEAIHIK
ncbi:MAG: Nif3-like dinuclear metal center hexameric protein [Clostridia bacterium]|jgi:dinuclear metal center YbgI/SA1388 family protein|nr:Nif3-like dinuclear metal center hexameric protein [Clostridia bacterium]